MLYKGAFHCFMTNYIHFNGKILPAGDALVSAANRGLRYGDGLFETMRVLNGSISLASFHFERLFKGLEILQFECPALFTPEQLTVSILDLCRKNKAEQGARVRLNVFRGNGGLYDPENHTPHIIIEVWPLEAPARMNENGLVIDVYEDARKHPDILSGLKSNNYLPYIMAALYAKKNRLNDCLLLNTEGRICDATIANVFWVKDGQIYTPPLSEGAIAGVMRRYLLEKVQLPVIEEALLIKSQLLQADEVFLTNAIQGIRWVKACGNSQYKMATAAMLYHQYIQTLWQ